MSRILALLFCLLATPALAIDFSAKLTDSDGQSVKVCVDPRPAAECGKEVEMTLGVAVRNALYQSYPDERELSGDEKFKRAELAQALVGASEIKVKAEDISLMKKLVAKLYGPLIVYRAWQLLDPK